MATTDEKIGRKGTCSNWGPPRKAFDKRSAGKRVRKAAREEIVKDAENETPD